MMRRKMISCCLAGEGDVPLQQLEEDAHSDARDEATGEVTMAPISAAANV